MNNSIHQFDLVLEQLLSAIGKDGCNEFQNFRLQSDLQELRSNYLDGCGQLTAEHRRLLRQFRASTAKRRKLRRQFKAIRDEIVIAEWLRQNPEADERELRDVLDDLRDTGEAPPDPGKIEDIEDLAIAFLLDSKGDYRKRTTTKLVVEPFLDFLDRHNITPSRKLPLNHMFKALFDWLRIEQKHRPTEAGIRTIRSDFKRSRKANR